MTEAAGSIDWRPISTARLDETEVLLWFPNGQWMTDSKAIVGFWGGDGDWYHCEADSRSLTDFGQSPSHWAEIKPPA